MLKMSLTFPSGALLDVKWRTSRQKRGILRKQPNTSPDIAERPMYTAFHAWEVLAKHLPYTSHTPPIDLPYSLLSVLLNFVLRSAGFAIKQHWVSGFAIRKSLLHCLRSKGEKETLCNYIWSSFQSSKLKQKLRITRKNLC